MDAIAATHDQDRRSAEALTGSIVARFRELHELRDKIGEQLRAALDEWRPHRQGEVVILAQAWSAVTDRLVDMDRLVERALVASARLEAARKAELEARGEIWRPRKLEWPDVRPPVRHSHLSYWLGDGEVLSGPSEITAWGEHAHLFRPSRSGSGAIL